MSSRAEARRAKRDLNGNTNRGHFIAVLYGVPWVVLVVVVAYSFLLGLGAAAQYMWTAAVLLAAVTVDTVARRGRTST